MKNLLIIYPHWPPSNLAGVHRPRLIANQLANFGWHPIVLCVEAKYYEEPLDLDMLQIVNKEVEVIYTKAYPIIKPRLIGDIGLRAFPYYCRKAKELLGERKIDFLWIPIPSFYTALLGRYLHIKTSVAYGIDYIDPWVRDISTRKDLRHRLSNLVGKVLEPVAVKQASLITGVSYEYYEPMLERNFRKRRLPEDGKQDKSLIKISKKDNKDPSSENKNSSEQYSINHVPFPYGFDPADHKIKLKGLQLPWSNEERVKPWIYAGAFLPNSRVFMKLLFKVIKEMRQKGVWDESIKLYFIGTGPYPGKSIQEYANELGIGNFVIEDRARYPYLCVLNFLSAADTVMVIGSSEKHYTASKVYQALLSEKPVWAVFHQKSSAVSVMEECEAAPYLVKYDEDMKEEMIKEAIETSLMARLNCNKWTPNLKTLEKYSAKESAKKLVEGIEKVLGHIEHAS
ncbi:MAG: hypothetical protein MI975_11875 [Cytophagales bacterium]|nr:hypothetical protein [Cytophagales bacterium]